VAELRAVFSPERTRWTGRVLLGLAVMILGALWTLDNLGLLDSEKILRFWPLVLVVVGTAKLLGLGTPRHHIAGIVLTLAGAGLLAGTLGLIDVGLWDLWPLFLVLLGANIVSRSLSRQRQGDAAEDRTARLNSFAFLSGMERKVAAQDFRGGELSALMGGIDLDLRGAKPAPGGATLDLFVWWGGIDLIVPDHWRVVTEATVLLGGIEDKTKTPPPDARDVLVVRGLVVMGGVEIKN
jgi:hypothetical protein